MLYDDLQLDSILYLLMLSHSCRDAIFSSKFVVQNEICLRLLFLDTTVYDPYSTHRSRVHINTDPNGRL